MRFEALKEKVIYLSYLDFLFSLQDLLFLTARKKIVNDKLHANIITFCNWRGQSD